MGRVTLHLPAVSLKDTERWKTVDAGSKGKPLDTHHEILLLSHPFLQQILWWKAYHIRRLKLR